MAEQNNNCRIDVHAHVVPDFYRDWCSDFGLNTDNLKMPAWDLDRSLSFMDQACIQAAIVSVSAPGVDLAEGLAETDMARRLNTYLAELVATNSDRFGFLSLLPMKTIDAALEEIAYSFDTLKADGVVLRPQVNGTYLGDERFVPVWEELNRRAAVVLIHPSELPNGAASGIPAYFADFLLDTVRGAISLMRSGAMDAYPDIKVILSHAGGFLPFIASRIAARVSPLENAEDGFRLMRRFYLDTSLSSSPTSLPSIAAFADPDKLLLGTDFPFASQNRANEFIEALDNFKELDLQTLTRNNADRLFPGRFTAGPLHR